MRAGAAGKHLLFQGPQALGSVRSPNVRADTHLQRTRELDGRGQILAVSDSGVDWDNCFVWESAKSPNFLDRGTTPPFNVIDPKRRKIIGYDFLSDCSLCGMCPQVLRALSRPCLPSPLQV